MHVLCMSTVQGDKNSVADALSRRPEDPQESASAKAELHSREPYTDEDEDEQLGIAHIFSPNEDSLMSAASALSDVTSPSNSTLTLSISADKELLDLIRTGYTVDPWIKSLITAQTGMPNIACKDGLWFLDDRLVIPNFGHVRETLFRLAHDTLGHFGFDKSYETLRHSFYWPRMRSDLESAYVPSCVPCQRNKSTTTKPIGPLHPLPVPEARGDSVAMDFIGPLPWDEGFDCILTMTDRLGSDVRLVPCSTTQTASDLAQLFFTNWYCENGLPLEIISDRDKLFLSRFWKALHKLTGVKLKLSTAYHPQTDGASERTNKTVNKCLRYYVDRNQTGWVQALPLIRFNIMNSINKSTGFSAFQLRMGRSPRVIPPLLPNPPNSQTPTDDTDNTARLAKDIIEKIHTCSLAAQDNLHQAKISQSAQVNKHRVLTFPFKVGECVRLSTVHRRHEYKTKGQNRVAKFMPRFDGPYTILSIDEPHSTIKLDLPSSAKSTRTFHTSQVLPYHENDPSLFPSRSFPSPPPIITPLGVEEYLIRDIVDERRSGRSSKYLVRWVGYGDEENRWLPRKELEDTEALDIWLAQRKLT